MSESPEQPHEGELILYQTAEGAMRIEVLYESETFWLNQKRIGDLFGVDVRTVSYHLNEIYDSGDLSPEGTLRKQWRVQTEGNREVRGEIEFYNLDAIMSVGSAEVAKRLAEEQYSIFRVQQDRHFESDFEREVKRISKKKSNRPEGGGA